MLSLQRLSFLLLVAQTSLAIKFDGVELKLGKRSCTCDFNIKVEEESASCGGKVKCDSKCSGKGVAELEDSITVEMKCSKGRCSIGKCVLNGPTIGPVPQPILTGSGSGPEPLPPTGSGPIPLPPTGSGPNPLPPTGSGPLPILPSGSGSGPILPTGPGTPMGCTCSCACPIATAEVCDCSCSCPPPPPMPTICRTGFTKVCPMEQEMRCPDMMVPVCPDDMMLPLTRKAEERMSMAVMPDDCQCIPDFILSMVPGMPPPGTMAAGRATRTPSKVVIPFGDTECKCMVDCKCAKGSCSKSKISCDRKCSGAARKVEIDGCGVMDLKASKGKVKIGKCKCAEEGGSGSGPVPLPIGSGPEPITLPGSGSELPSGEVPIPIGSGPEPIPLPGSGSEPPSGEIPTEPTTGSGTPLPILPVEPPVGATPRCACVGV